MHNLKTGNSLRWVVTSISEHAVENLNDHMI